MQRKAVLCMATLTFTEAKFEGGWLCLKVNEPAPARAFILRMVQRLYDCIIKEHREKRSLDSNGYAWLLLDKLAEKMSIPKTEIYRSYIREIGGNSETVCVQKRAAERLISGWCHNGIGWQAEEMPSKIPGCANVVLYYGSSTYDTAQMSRLINMIVEDCKSLGIETLPPDKLAVMKEEWGRE